jgi:hypothetical protein
MSDIADELTQAVLNTFSPVSTLRSEATNGKKKPARQLTTPKPFCLVLMPFSADFNDVYALGIKDACTQAGAYCERIDEQIFHESMLGRIYNQISKADIIIADMSGKNPNVFYEVGYAHALGKLTILLTNDAADIPFDLHDFPHIVYKTGLTGLRSQLAKRVDYFIKNPPQHVSDIKLGIQVFLNNQNAAHGDATIRFNPRTPPYLTIVVQNTTPHVIEPGDLRIAIATYSDIVLHPVHFHTVTTAISQYHYESISLPDGKHIHHMRDFDRILPDALASQTIGFTVPPLDAETSAALKVFTKTQGRHEFPFKFVMDQN